MKRWIAERGVNGPSIWRDEDVAMATELYTQPDRDTARTMVVGMLTSELLADWDNEDRRIVLLGLIKLIALEHLDRVELPWNQVFYQIRPA